jgi:hypothetical protein
VDDEAVFKCFPGHLEVGLRAQKLFDELAIETEALGMAVVDLNTVRTSPKPVSRRTPEQQHADAERPRLPPPGLESRFVRWHFEAAAAYLCAEFDQFVLWSRGDSGAGTQCDHNLLIHDASLPTPLQAIL